jgi:hypothetical protein
MCFPRNLLTHSLTRKRGDPKGTCQVSANNVYAAQLDESRAGIPANVFPAELTYCNEPNYSRGLTSRFEFFSTKNIFWGT